MKLVSGIILAAAIAAQAKRPQWDELEGYTFEQYVEDFGKHYPTPEEHETRRHLFEGKLADVREHNAAGGASWRKGINQFSDMTHEEYAVRLGYRRGAGSGAMEATPWSSQPASTIPADTLPTEVNWWTQNVVTAVKDQGRCGSCWAHAATETLESHVAINSGELYVLSTQQLVSCSPNSHDCGGWGGCAGSTAELAYTYLTNIGGQVQEWSFPYVSYMGTTNGTCTWNNSGDDLPPTVSIDGFVKLTSNNATAVMTALANVGPLAVNVAAAAWMDYESGIYDGCGYDNVEIDHVVELVGYGSEDGQDYWLIRNSWSAGWGEAGFIRLKRNPADATPCGPDNAPHDGTGCLPGPSSVKVCGTCGVLYDASYPLNARPGKSSTTSTPQVEL